MRKYYNNLALFFICIFFASCANKLKPPMQRIYVSTERNLKIVSLNGLKPNDSSITIKSYREALEAAKIKRLSRGFLIQRSDKPVPIVLQIDSLQKIVFLQPRRTYSWLLNAKYLLGPNEPTDYYIGKRWKYPKRNFISSDDTIMRSVNFAPKKIGSIHAALSYSIPIFNLKTDKGQYATAGVLGIQYGVDYYYGENKFLSFSIGAATNVLPLPIDYFGTGYIERASALYANVQNNMLFGRFDFGYGVNISRLFYTRIPYGDTTSVNTSMNITGLGLSFSAYYKIMPNFKVGFLYQPNLLNLNSSPTFSYQHYMAVQCTLDISTKRNSRERKNMRSLQRY